jgi:hypothetical protein
MSTMELIKSPGVPMVLFLYGHVMLLGLAYTAGLSLPVPTQTFPTTTLTLYSLVAPVFWFTDIDLGGYGFSPRQISFFIGGGGLAQAIWLLFAFPMLQRRYGTGAVLRGCLSVWPIFFASAPLCNMFLRNGWTTGFWIIAPVLQIGGSGVAMAFSNFPFTYTFFPLSYLTSFLAGVQLALNDISPSPSTLGTLNGVALTMTAGIRTVGPAIFTSLFATGARTQILNGYLVWVVLISVAIAGSAAVRYLPEKAEGKLKDVNEGEDEDIIR